MFQKADPTSLFYGEMKNRVSGKAGLIEKIAHMEYSFLIWINKSEYRT